MAFTQEYIEAKGAQSQGRLDIQIKDLQARLCLAWKIMDQFEEYMQGPKFQGTCEDYMHLHEIRSLLRRVDLALCGVSEESL